MRIAIGGDHAGFEYKKQLIRFIEDSLEYAVHDFGPYSGESVDYPDFVHPLCTELVKGKFDFGIVICGSGNGVAITANKHCYVRAALCFNVEIANLARLHNDANICAIPARFLPYEEVENIVETFICGTFEGGRHSVRVGKISKF
jgi:ribose 5-phosphate isomerase B